MRVRGTETRGCDASAKGYRLGRLALAWWERGSKGKYVFCGNEVEDAANVLNEFDVGIRVTCAQIRFSSDIQQR